MQGHSGGVVSHWIVNSCLLPHVQEVAKKSIIIYLYRHKTTFYINYLSGLTFCMGYLSGQVLLVCPTAWHSPHVVVRFSFSCDCRATSGTRTGHSWGRGSLRCSFRCFCCGFWVLQCILILSYKYHCRVRSKPGISVSSGWLVRWASRAWFSLSGIWVLLYCDCPISWHLKVMVWSDVGDGAEKLTEICTPLVKCHQFLPSYIADNLWNNLPWCCCSLGNSRNFSKGWDWRSTKYLLE